MKNKTAVDFKSTAMNLNLKKLFKKSVSVCL